MNVKHIRRVLRWVAGGSVPVALSFILVGLLKQRPFDHADIWRGSYCWLLILGIWLVVETVIGCADRNLAAQPKPYHIVAATIAAMEEEAARDAGLPLIADGERRR